MREQGPLSRAASVGDLLAVLGQAGLRLVSSAEGRELAVTRTALHDPYSELDECAGGVLLAPGLRGGGEQARRVVGTAARKGFSCVVVKAYGDAVHDLTRAADAAGLALLVVHDDVEWLHLDSLLNNALVTATHVGRSLSALAVGDLFALAGAIADTVGGATAIEDFSRRILAYSHSPDHLIDEDRREGILGRQVPDLPENEEQYRLLYRSPGVVRFSATPPALPRMAVAVRAGTELLGSIWVVDADGALGPQAEESLLGAAPIAALHLLRARSSEDLARQQRGEIVRQLLERQGNPADAAGALGLPTEGPFTVLAFAPANLRQDEPPPTAGRLLDMVTLHCEARIGHTGSVLIGGTVFALLAGPRLGSSEALHHLATEVVTAARSSMRLRLLAGIGPVVTDLNRISDTRHEAARVIALLRERPDLGPVATSERVSDQLALAALAEHLGDDERLVARRARAMAEYDESRGTQYRRIVLTVLDAMGDVNSAAKQLSMHPNTVRYRLHRAAKLFQLDLSDPEQVLPLWVTLTCQEPRSRA